MFVCSSQVNLALKTFLPTKKRNRVKNMAKFRRVPVQRILQLEYWLPKPKSGGCRQPGNSLRQALVPIYNVACNGHVGNLAGMGILEYTKIACIGQACS